MSCTDEVSWPRGCFTGVIICLVVRSSRVRFPLFSDQLDQWIMFAVYKHTIFNYCCRYSRYRTSRYRIKGPQSKQNITNFIRNVCIDWWYIIPSVVGKNLNLKMQYFAYIFGVVSYRSYCVVVLRNICPSHRTDCLNNRQYLSQS